MKIQRYDIVIIGSGVSGLFAAYNILNRNDFDVKILIITKAPLGESNSRYAQGGIAAVVSNNSKDSIFLHINDTLKSGAELCDENVVKLIIENSQNAIIELTEIHAGFDRDNEGNFEYNLGGAHSINRVLHSGDITGMVMINALTEAVKKHDNIDIMEKKSAVELIISDDKECEGVIIFDNKTKEHEIILSKNIILSTGGAGQVYKYTTNPYSATGDGIFLAYNAGAEIQDMEFFQFHPTALALHSETKNRYLISEALRGKGAKLINSRGQEFMANYSSQKELDQRDIISRAIISEMKNENKQNVFLDASKIDTEILIKNFPSIIRKCMTLGIDITKEPIPVAPAAHYMIGGVKAKPDGQTSINGLYAVGETASTNFHGANRLASNSLLECVVCAKELSKNIKIKKNKSNFDLSKIIYKYENSLTNDTNDYKKLKNDLKDIMWNKAGIIRSEKSLKEAVEEIKILKSAIQNIKCFSTSSGYEFRNMITVSELIVKSALSRKESRGAHYRTDFPNKNTHVYHTSFNKNTINKFMLN